MTIIACRDGVMAADTAVWSGNLLSGHVAKIARAPDGSLGAAGGDTDACEVFLDHVRKGTATDAIETEGEFSGLLLRPDGTVLRIRQNAPPYVLRGEFFAVGCAEDVAMGAMAAGASAEEAVRIAIRLYAFCGGDVQVERLSNAV